MLRRVRGLGDNEERAGECRSRDRAEQTLGPCPPSPRESDGYAERDENESGEGRLPATGAVEVLPRDVEVLPIQDFAFFRFYRLV